MRMSKAMWNAKYGQCMSQTLYKAAAESGNCPTVQHARRLLSIAEAYNEELPLSDADFRIMIAIGK